MLGIAHFLRFPLRVALPFLPTPNLRPPPADTRYFAILLSAVAASLSIRCGGKRNPIKNAMDFAHQSAEEKSFDDKMHRRQRAGADVKKTLDLYKAMADTKPPKG